MLSYVKRLLAGHTVESYLPVTVDILGVAKILVAAGNGSPEYRRSLKGSYIRSSNKQELSSVDQFIVVMVQCVCWLLSSSDDELLTTVFVVSSITVRTVLCETLSTGGTRI